MKLYKKQEDAIVGWSCGIVEKEATISDIRAAAKALGYAVVPLEPTEEMLTESWLLSGESWEMRPRYCSRMSKHYKAMLAAAEEE